ncbi:unnamed protein product [Mytilus coruscus]|uniref:Endonuclease/exonuclease/phosphatase domain-containing protein n=1 Tax=Mytilus coruscus TaxID=42192 RepID=A0A6J8BNY3_MYTCO|nr:unnamed protein product [Mytilus coruscus]
MSGDKQNDTSVLDTSDVIAMAHGIIYNDDEDIIEDTATSAQTSSSNKCNKRNKRKFGDSPIPNKIDTPAVKKPKSDTKTKTSDCIQVEVEVHVDSQLSPEMFALTKMISKLSSDMKTMFGDMNTRIIELEENLDRKLTAKFKQVLDKRVNSEMSNIRKEIDKTVNCLKKDFNQDLRVVEEKINEISVTAADSELKASGIDRNVVIRNLPESKSENLKLKVAALFTEGLKLSHIGTFGVERKYSRSSKPGVVVVSCKTKTDRVEILSAKKKLKSSRHYSNVYIQPDQTLQQRIEAENFRTLVHTLQTVTPNLSVRGSRVVVNGSSSDNRSPRSVHRKQYSKGDDRKRSQNSHEQTYRRSRSPADFNNGHNDRYKHSEQWSSTGSPRRHSRCGEESDYIVGVDNIMSRNVVDFKCNSHCNSFLDFLINSNCCMLNGRKCINNDFTYVSTKGQSVVDYMIIKQDNLSIDHFNVIRASDFVTEAGLNICGIDSRYVPDHSFLKCSVNLQSVGVVEDFDKNERCRSNVHLKKYDLRKIPLDFLKSDEIQTLLLQTIKDIEDSVVSQDNLNNNLFILRECKKETTNHIRFFKCGTDIPIPESLLILNRAGLGLKLSNFSECICLKHRQEFGLQWTRRKRTCCHPQ